MSDEKYNAAYFRLADRHYEIDHWRAFARHMLSIEDWDRPVEPRQENLVYVREVATAIVKRWGEDRAAQFFAMADGEKWANGSQLTIAEFTRVSRMRKWARAWREGEVTAERPKWGGHNKKTKDA